MDVSYDIVPVFGVTGDSATDCVDVVGVSLYNPEIGSNDIVATCDDPFCKDNEV